MLKFKTYQDSLHWTPTQASTGGAPEIEAAKSAKSQLERALSALLLSENLVVLTGLGTSLCVKDTAGNAIAPTMGDLWAKLSSATPQFGEILTKVHHPADASGTHADLHELGFAGDEGLYLRLDLGRVAGRVGASVLLHVGKQEPVVACALGAFKTASGCRHELGIALAERCQLQEKHELVFNPMLEVTDG